VTGPRYAEPETLIAGWLHEQLDVKTWADPALPDGWNYTAPIVHVQRGVGEGDPALTLDVALLDVDVYAALPDNARAVAELVRARMRLTLPRHVFPGGVFVQAVTCTSAPAWLPTGGPARRGATYRAVLHGVAAA
jgi:hypothetical protein